jgi:hypothetical protein
VVVKRFRSINVGDHLVAVHLNGHASHVVVATVPEDRRDDSGSLATSTRGGGPHAWVRLARSHPPTPWPTSMLHWPAQMVGVDCRCHLFVLAADVAAALAWGRDSGTARQRWTYIAGPSSIEGRAITDHQVVRVPGWSERRNAAQLDALLTRTLARTALRYGCASQPPHGIDPIHRSELAPREGPA